MRKNLVLMVAGTLALLAYGCSDSNSGGNDNDGGTGGADGGTSGGGADGGGTTGGNTGSTSGGDTTGGTTGGAIACTSASECNDITVNGTTYPGCCNDAGHCSVLFNDLCQALAQDDPQITNCGGKVCANGFFSGGTDCCTPDDTCGLLDDTTGDCTAMAPAVADPSCPTGLLGGEGCCNNGKCGTLAADYCIVNPLGTPQACGN